MLPRLSLLQIGDVHLPGARSKPSVIDGKDPRFPRDLKGLMAANPTKQVFKKIHEILQSGRIESILFMGDLTDIGDLPGYKSCANYLAGALELGGTRSNSSVKVGIVFGNHDVDRELAKKPGLATKFKPLSEALKSAGLPLAAVDKPIWMALGSSEARATLALINSCWGCGAKEYIPAEFREQVSTAIDAAIAAGDTEKNVRAYYDRQFDTPAFSDATLSSLANPPQEHAGHLLVACAHHNLLPQRQPRLAPYTELVNSGALRGTLQELGRPVIYLHGHIHEDPIEVITGRSGEPLVCISAPEASSGFNELEIAFNAVGAPLSCRVVPWRFDQSGIFRALEAVSIPLLGQRRRATNQSLTKFYAELLQGGELYWSNIIETASSIYPENTAENVQESLELLAADGRVEIDNYRSAPINWIVRSRL